MDTLLSADEVRAVLRISRRTFDLMVSRGEAPPHLAVGRQRRWREADVSAWIDSHMLGTRDVSKNRPVAEQQSPPQTSHSAAQHLTAEGPGSDVVSTRGQP
jgi:excisionase family DNA binding protein